MVEGCTKVSARAESGWGHRLRGMGHGKGVTGLTPGPAGMLLRGCGGRSPVTDRLTSSGLWVMCGRQSAVGGSVLCTAHGGGRRCQFQDCTRSAQSSTNFCVRHGGGRKCQVEGCQKVRHPLNLTPDRHPKTLYVPYLICSTERGGAPRSPEPRVYRTSCQAHIDYCLGSADLTCRLSGPLAAAGGARPHKLLRGPWGGHPLQGGRVQQGESRCRHWGQSSTLTRPLGATAVVLQSWLRILTLSPVSLLPVCLYQAAVSSKVHMCRSHARSSAVAV